MSSPADALSAPGQDLPRDPIAELLGRIAKGDRVAFRALHDATVRRLVGVALRITGDAALARDVVQDALLQVWQQAERYDPARGAAEPWLVGLVRYRALAVVRRRGREVLGHEPADEPDPSPDSLARLMRSAEGAALRDCLEQAAPEGQRMIVLAYVEGLSHSQLAQRLNLPLGTVKSSMRRTLLALRRCLER